MLDIQISKWGLRALLICAAGLIISFSCKETSGENSDEISSKQSEEKPIIIWYYHLQRDSLESLRLVLDSGLITHVDIGGKMHRKDSHYMRKYTQKLSEAMRIIKNSGVKSIWSRCLWPMYVNDAVTPDVLFDPNYYIQEIKALREEAQKAGTDFVAFDTEPYAYSPLKVYKKGERRLTATELARLEQIIDKVTDTVGKVDFIYPAGSFEKKMPYEILAKLGVTRISESTFYANYERIKRIDSPYEIFGAYLNIVSENKPLHKLPYFRVTEIFENSYLWSGKKGLFLYCKENNAEAVAHELANYAKTLPRKETIQRQDPNTEKTK
jgi:hypothetical protein